VVETDPGLYYQSEAVLRPKVAEHEATKMLSGAGAFAVMPRCRSVAVESKAGVQNEALLMTSEKSYAKINPLTQTLQKEAGDPDGPFSVAAAAENAASGAKIVVFGSTDFISSFENAKFAGNLTSFMGAAAWASGNRGAIPISPKSMANPALQITSSNQSLMLSVLLIGVFPLLILLCGFVVLQRRIRR